MAMSVQITDFCYPTPWNIVKFPADIRWHMPKESNMQTFFLSLACFMHGTVIERRRISAPQYTAHILLHDIKKLTSSTIKFSCPNPRHWEAINQRGSALINSTVHMRLSITFSDHTAWGITTLYDRFLTRWPQDPQQSVGLILFIRLTVTTNLVK